MKRGIMKKVSSYFDCISLEHKILEFWKRNNTFKKLVAKNREKKHWSFLDGPITANNPMGVHHAWGRTYKDIYQRYHAMLGFDQRYQNGFDCQGLWVEVEVEKELGLKSKNEIEAYGIEKFINQCKKRVRKYSQLQTQQSIRLGYWMDWENSYYTMDDTNNYTIWKYLKKCYDRGWIYKGHDVMPWCIDCGAALSQHEIATEGYREMEHMSVYVIFPIVNRENENLLIWTTTPWTLPANVGAAVHGDFIYAKIKQGTQIFYLVKERLDQVVAPKGPYKILDELPGANLAGLEFYSPFQGLPVQKDIKHTVLLWKEVSAAEGTGIVHIAPGCGKEDFALGQEFNLATIAPLDQQGIFGQDFDWLSGKNVKQVNKPIIDNLMKKKVLYKQEEVIHRYPVCWRHGSELVFRLVDEWFIKMDELRQQIKDITKKIRWIPQYGEQLELDWLDNMSDWMISKKRYWGLALPIYECSHCGYFEVIGSQKELHERAVQGWNDFEGHSPHRPYIDYVKVQCNQCGNLVARIKDVGNPWLDAGIVPYSTMRYLKDRKYWEKWFPADFITECFPGQFRNWFYSILAMSTVMENREPFRTVLGHGLVHDENGEEMHKSTGNAIWFDDAAENIGVDTMRWMFAEHSPFTNINFGYDPAKEIRKHLVTLWNTYTFLTNYAILDRINPENLNKNSLDFHEIDRWIFAKLHQLIKTAQYEYKNFNVSAFVKKAGEFLDDLSNWYIRRNRRRFWRNEKDNDKKAAYFTIHTVLVTFLKLMAPIIPFITEHIYQNIVVSNNSAAPVSIHLCDFPTVHESYCDEELVKTVDYVIRIVKAGRALRNKCAMKIRQPLSELKIWPKKDYSIDSLKKYVQHIKEELNIKKVSFIESNEELLQNEANINYKTLGPQYGKETKKIQELLRQIPVKGIMQRIVKQQNLELRDNDSFFQLKPDDIIIKSKPKKNVRILETDYLLLGLNILLTENLLIEGIARDLVRHIQDLRKQANLEMNDFIYTYYKGTDTIHKVFTQHAKYIKSETLTYQINHELHKNMVSKEIRLNGDIVVLGLKKV